MFLECYPTGCQVYLLPRKLRCPLKRNYFNRKYIFQPLIFRGELLNFGGSKHIYPIQMEPHGRQLWIAKCEVKVKSTGEFTFFFRTDSCDRKKMKVKDVEKWREGSICHITIFFTCTYIYIYTLLVIHDMRWWFQLEAALPGEMIQFD